MLLRTLYALLEDLLLLQNDAPQLVRNTDLAAELAKLASSVSFDWLEQADLPPRAGRVRHAPQPPPLPLP